MTLQAPNPISSIAGIIKAIAIICLLVIVGYLVWTKAQLQDQVTNDKVLIADLQKTNQDWKQQTETANKSLDELRTDAQKRALQELKAENDAKVASDKINAMAKKLMDIQASSKDDCQATKDYLRNYYKGKP